MTAKERFSKSGDAAAFRDLVQSETFLRGLEASQVAYADSLPAPENPFIAEANGIRIDAMRWFRTTLLTIADIEAPPDQSKKPQGFKFTH